MLVHPRIDPVALQLGPVAIHWYGLTYLLAFGLFLFLANLRLRHEPYRSIQGPAAWSLLQLASGWVTSWPEVIDVEAMV